MSCKAALIMAITFFCLRTAVCLYFSITAIREAPYDYDGDVVVPSRFLEMLRNFYGIKVGKKIRKLKFS
jgi:hypothetical protein